MENVCITVLKNLLHIHKRSFEIAAAVIITLLIILISYFRIFEVFELATLDLRFKIRPAQKVSDDIVIIEVAQDTLDQVGTWPIDRGFHAHLIDVLTAFKTRSIIFDMVFAKEQNPYSDNRLVESTRLSQRTYIASVFRLSQEFADFPKAVAYESYPFSELAEVVRGVGHINIVNDIDGKRRRIPLFVRYRDSLFPQLSFLAVCDYFKKVPDKLDIIPKKHIQLTDKIKIPVDENGMTLINFAGKWGEAFKHYSFIDILKSYIQLQEGERPRIDLNQLTDKICIVGLTAVGTHDLNPIPLQTDYPMVGVHANVINSILNNSFIIRANKQINALILILLALITSLSVLKLKPLRSLLVALGLLALFTVSAFVIFAFFRIWIDLFYPLILISLVYLFSTFYKYISERNKRMVMERELDIAHNIQKSFLKDVPPEKRGLDIAALINPARTIGGDLYDFVDISEGKIGIMVGDVSGKGVPAALFMAKTVSDFRFHSKTQIAPNQAITELNNQISTESTSGLFVTICYVVIDVNEKQIHIVDAGHLPVIAAHKDKPTEALKVEGAMAVGIMDGIEYPQKTFSFNPGDVFLLYTDGVTEARNNKRQEFGEERIKKVLTESKLKTTKEIIEDILKNIRKFQGRAPQHDDITLIAIKV